MTKLKFTQRPTPVLAEHRTLYKIAQVLLILDVCGRARKCSVLKLHLFNWALKSDKRLKQLQDASRKGGLELPIWGFDPALAIALKYAIEDRIVSGEGGGVQVSENGNKLLEFLLQDKELLSREKNSLKMIGKGITEKMVDSVAKGWGVI